MTHRAKIIAGFPAITGGPFDEALADPTGVILTDNRALDGQAAPQPSIRRNRFDPEQFVRLAKSAEIVQEKTGAKLGGIDWKAVMGFVTAGAGIAGASTGGPGAIVGAVVGLVVGLTMQLIGGAQPSDWADAAPGVHRWFTDWGPNAFLHYVRTERRELLATDAQTLTKALLLWWLEHDGVVITDAPGASHYSGKRDVDYYIMAGGFDALNPLYTAAGVDYARTRLEAHPEGTTSAALPGEVSSGAGGVWMLDQKIYKYDGPDSPDSGQSSGAGVALLVLGAVALSKS